MKSAKVCDQFKLQNKTSLHWVSGLTVIYPKIQILFYKSKSFKWFTIKSLMKRLSAHTHSWEVLFWRTHRKCLNYSECCWCDVNMTVSRLLLCLFYQRLVRVSPKKSTSLLSWSFALLLMCIRCAKWSLLRVLIGAKKISRCAANATQTKDVCPERQTNN